MPDLTDDAEASAALLAAGYDLEPRPAARLVLAIAAMQRDEADARDDYTGLVAWREIVEITSQALHGHALAERGAPVRPADPEAVGFFRRLLRGDAP